MSKTDVRAQAVAVADRQMRAGGYEALNFGVIAKTVGTVRPNLHHHFGSKEGLAAETVARYREGSMAAMGALIADHRDDFAGYLRAFEAAYLDWLPGSDPTQGCICAQLVRDAGAPDGLREAAVDFFADKEASLRDLIARSVIAGNLRAETDPDRLAARTAAMLMGLQQSALASPDRAKLADDLHGMMDDWVAPHLPEGA